MNIGPSAGGWDGALPVGILPPRRPVAKGAHMKPRVGLVAVALTGILLLTAAQAGANELAATVRNLAENVLGAGSVTSLAITDRGATILIRWESVTFRSGQSLEVVRDGLVVEAQLATGSILGRLYTVSRIKFSIRRTGETLATGENSRSGGLRLAFADSIGGGTYVPKASGGQTKTKSGGGSSSVSY